MYEHFFGFKEKPFKLVPNPDYLFLGKSHEEALAHLNYALSQGDGFVEITGEVGTGKTTLCRCFLENLEDDAVAAYIFNPKLGPRQLIKTIIDELGIKYETDNTKSLIDNLNNFLMRQKTRRRKVILLIDEAQNLSKNVLEQLRLLSNLETNKEKLMQIILVGQPELSDILDSHELRQLGQRITLRYHLSPLSPKECIDYIQYRISIAAQKSGLKFDRAAYRLIYKYSRGIPRVINITCDRILLTAFGLNKQKISGSIAKDSIKELKSRGVPRKFALLNWKKVITISAAALLILAAAIFSRPLRQGIQSWFNPAPTQQSETAAPDGSGINSTQDSDSKVVKDDSPASTGNPVQIVDNDSGQTAADKTESSTFERTDLQAEKDMNPPVSLNSDYDISEETSLNVTSSQPEPKEYEQDPDLGDPISLADYLTAMDIKGSRLLALQDAMDLWQTPIKIQPYLNGLDDDQAFFRLTAKPKGVFIHRIETNLEMLKRLNMPAILELFPKGNEEPGYLTLSKIEEENYIFGNPADEKVVISDADQINLYWSGTAYLPWKNFLSIWGTIPKHSNKDSIITLKLLLHDLGYNEVEINEEYDDWTRRAVEEVQAKYGIPVDGFVGPLTKMILYQEKESFEIPRLAN
ncbi:MAG: AAA family ATPase [bacterium]|nr:AAA family ATPase [bacterium]